MKSRSVTKAADRTKRMVYTALFAALIAVLSQISIPLPSGVPITLQTFAVAFAGFFLGRKYGLAAVAVYVALGAAGAPVFAGFTGGAYKLVNVTGGFIWGFFPFVIMTGARSPETDRISAAVLSVLGLAMCHLIGVAQYAALTGNGFAASALVVSAPYIVKDVLSVTLAAMLSSAVSRRLRSPFRSAAADGRKLMKELKNIS